MSRHASELTDEQWAHIAPLLPFNPELTDPQLEVTYEATPHPRLGLLVLYKVSPSLPSKNWITLDVSSPSTGVLVVSLTTLHTTAFA